MKFPLVRTVSLKYAARRGIAVVVIVSCVSEGWLTIPFTKLAFLHARANPREVRMQGEMRFAGSKKALCGTAGL